MFTISVAVPGLYKTVNNSKASNASNCLIRPQRFHHYIKQSTDHGTFWHRSSSHKKIFLLTDNKTVGLKYFLKNINISLQVI